MTNTVSYKENQPGEFYVHDACIACDTCKDIAPDNFVLTSISADSEIRPSLRVLRNRSRDL